MPAWVRRPILRGLSAAPEARYPSMAALLADLARDPAAAWRRALLGAAVAVLVGGAAASGWAMGAFRDPCAHPEQDLAGVWDEGVKGRVREAFLGTGKPYAADTVTRVVARLDGYGASWAAMRGEVCRASRGDKQRREILGLRDACLDRRRGQLQALATLFAEKPDPKVLDKAGQAAADLAPLSSCADTEMLHARVRPPEAPAARARVEALQPRADRLEALHQAGKFKEGLALGEPLLAEAEAAGYAPLRAQVQYWMGRLHAGAGEYERGGGAPARGCRVGRRGGQGRPACSPRPRGRGCSSTWGSLRATWREATVIRGLGPTALARVEDPASTGDVAPGRRGRPLATRASIAEAKAAEEQVSARALRGGSQTESPSRGSPRRSTDLGRSRCSRHG